jgi:deazaflavin-dependent oxidoreductase (nitroreductase family)
VSNEEALSYNERNIAEFRASGGRPSSFDGAPVLLLTTTGAKSGQRRTSPMMYLADESDPQVVYIFASAAGADKNPDWYHNIVGHPEALIVEIGEATVAATPRVLDDPERGRIYAIQAGRFPGFAEYEAKTARVIPVIALTLPSPVA